MLNKYQQLIDEAKEKINENNASKKRLQFRAALDEQVYIIL
jgi:hypothetical protein